MRRLFLAALFTTVSALGAQATDVINKSPIVDMPAGFNWTGAYAGVQAGYGWGTVDGVGCAAPGAKCNGLSGDADGFLGGVHVGFNHQFSNNVVAGIEGDFELSGQDGVIPYGAGVYYLDADVKWQASIRARIGYSIDRTLVYATGGVAFAKADYAFGFTSTVPFHTYSEKHTGWTLGTGVEHAFTDNITARIEYRYADFGDVENYNFAAASYGKHDLISHTVRIGLSHKF